MSDLTVIRFSPEGDPATEWLTWDPLPPEDLASKSQPVQRGHEYYSAAEGRVPVGVWDCTPYDQVKAAYPVDEFMLLLEGSLDIEDADGNTHNFRAGEALIIPKGAVVQWKQPGYLLKFYFIHDDPEAPGNDGLGVIRIDPDADLPAVTNQDTALYESEVPQMGWLTLYQSPGGHFQAGVWDCSPMKRVATTLERSELMHILEGSGSITNADGVVFEYKAGDTFLVPQGMGYQWQNDSYVKKLFCSYTP